MTYEAMTAEDLDEVLALWFATEGLTMREADSRAHLLSFLERNPGFSFIAQDDTGIVGAVICGHDGRRGYIHHMAVAPSHRRQGIARQLADRCLAALTNVGISKCHLFVRAENEVAKEFWSALGWVGRTDIVTMSRNMTDRENA